MANKQSGSMPASSMNVDQLVSDDSFRAWAEGRAGIDQKKQWDRWIQQSPKNRRLARRAQAKITGFSFTSSVTPHTSQAWNRLQEGIAGHGRSQRFPASHGRRKPWTYYGIAASILVIIAAGLSALLMRPSPGKAPAPSIQQTIQTAYGERKKITLSNGASIVLNAHSTLTYKSNPSEGSGDVHVTLQGEAYFATAKHIQPGHRVFTVQTPDGAIADIGTQFVVSTREEHTRVVLKRGQVAIDQSAGSSKKPVVMHPGQMATFSKSSRHIQLKAVNPAVYTSWTTNKLLFDHTPLRAIATRLEHTFGVDVLICRARLARRPLSGAIKNAGLPVIVSAVAEALNTTYTIKDHTVYFGHTCQ